MSDEVRGLRKTEYSSRSADNHQRDFLMPTLPVLILNSGSSSIKFSLYEAGAGERRKLYEGAVDGIGTDQGKFWI